MEDDLVSGAEIGRRLGVSRERVRQWASDPKYGFPPSLARVGGAKVWWWATVAEWVESRESRNSKSKRRSTKMLHSKESRST